MKINYLLLLALAIFLRCERLSSQVLISEIIEGAYLLGPESIDVYCEELSFKYIDDIEKHLEGLRAQKQFVNREVAKLENRPKLKKRDKKTLLINQAYVKQIEREIAATDSLNMIWNEHIMQQEVLIDLFSQINSGKCLTVRINDKDYSTDEIHLTKQILKKELEYFESFAAEFTPAGTKWIEKVDENCLSANQEDCKIKCLVKVSEKYNVNDIRGLAKSFEYAPFNFAYDGNKEECFLKKTVILEDATQEFYTLKIKNNSDEAIRTVDFTEVKCN